MFSKVETSGRFRDPEYQTNSIGPRSRATSARIITKSSSRRRDARLPAPAVFHQEEPIDDPVCVRSTTSQTCARTAQSSCRSARARTRFQRLEKYVPSSTPLRKFWHTPTRAAHDRRAARAWPSGWKRGPQERGHRLIRRLGADERLWGGAVSRRNVQAARASLKMRERFTDARRSNRRLSESHEEERPGREFLARRRIWN